MGVSVKMSLRIIDEVIRNHDVHVEKRYYHLYRDYEKRHLRWKHDKQDGIQYQEPTPPDRHVLETQETIPLNLTLLKALRSQGVATNMGM